MQSGKIPFSGIYRETCSWTFRDAHQVKQLFVPVPACVPVPDSLYQCLYTALPFVRARARTRARARIIA